MVIFIINVMMEIMAPNPEQAKIRANQQLRDERGRFIKIKTKIETSTPPTFIPEFEKPLLQISLTNPFKKILYWLNEIRRRQTTTLAVKLSIPLIALPVLVFAAFQVGRFSGISFQKSQNLPTSFPVPAPTFSPEVALSKAGVLKIAKSPQTVRYLLQPRFGDVIILQIPQNFNLANYSNKQVFVTGTYNKSTNTLKVQDIAEIELFNVLQISPEATPTASPK